MPYATTTQIQIAAGGSERFVQLFDWDGDTVADSAVVAQIQAEVDAWIDSYAGRRFAVPISAPSSVLVAHSAAEVVYRAQQRRGMASDTDREQHESRLAWLRDLAGGRVVPSEPQPTAATSVRSGWVDRTDGLTRDGLKGAW